MTTALPTYSLTDLQALRTRADEEGRRLDSEAIDLLIAIHLGMPLRGYIASLTLAAIATQRVDHNDLGQLIKRSDDEAEAAQEAEYDERERGVDQILDHREQFGF